MTYQPDKYQQMALKTWYPLDHKLHFDLTHPAIKLAGEAGEILDQYAKHLYKPGVEYTREEFLDELGDLWYYVRILGYLDKLNTDDILPMYNNWISSDPVYILSRMCQYASKIATNVVSGGNFDMTDLYSVMGCLLVRLDRLDCTIDELSELNYKKLNSDPANHGWKNA